MAIWQTSADAESKSKVPHVCLVQRLISGQKEVTSLLLTTVRRNLFLFASGVSIKVNVQKLNKNNYSSLHDPVYNVSQPCCKRLFLHFYSKKVVK